MQRAKEPQPYVREVSNPLGVNRTILDFEKAECEPITKYGELKDLLGMKLHYIEPCVYAGENDYDGLFLYFIGEDGLQKALLIDANMDEPSKIGMLLYK